MDRKRVTSSLPRDRAASVLLGLANTSTGAPFLQTFHRSDRYDNRYIVSRGRELDTTFCNIKYLCNIASDRAADVRMVEGRPWIFGGGPDQVLLLLV